MPQPDPSREEAIRSLDARAAALEARTAQPVRDYGAKAAGYGYRLMGILLGGLFVGLGFGFAVDAVLKTTPWGTIIGVLVGFGVSVWMTVRSAQRISAELSKEAGPPVDLPFEDDEED